MLEHGVPISLSSRVRRVVAPNPGVMTGAGTNTYLLGVAQVAVLDPGPAIASHVDAILRAAGDRIRWIVCTHTHPDHSPAWQALAAATGAEVLGALPADDMLQDETFVPTRELRHHDLLRTAEFTLRAVHTPGHVSNHFCFLLEEEGMLFAGDHIMNGSTVVIVPPGGDMKAYIDSLRLLLDYPARLIAPGHGELMEDAAAVIGGLVDHRLQRERKVVAGLRQLGSATLDALVAVVYDDVDASVHRVARLSLHAHLIKLLQEQRAAHRAADDTWQFLSA
jgi:glyoxylase-like metal-dependent hydrolase (beta-lactamase superfamily II)